MPRVLWTTDAWSTLTCAEYSPYMNFARIYCSMDYYDYIFGVNGTLRPATETCCVDGLDGCIGVCVSSTSTVTAMTTANPKANTLPISELAIGDKVLAATAQGKHLIEEVEGLGAPPRQEPGFGALRRAGRGSRGKPRPGGLRHAPPHLPRLLPRAHLPNDDDQGQ